MASRDHYQHAFEAYVRQHRLPYVSVDEARRALLPRPGSPAVDSPAAASYHPANTAATLKSFDFVVYAPDANLLVEVKGRKVVHRRPPSVARPCRPADDLARPPRVRLESWVTQDDVDSLGVWEDLFGPGFSAVFAFVYWCDQLPASALFEEFIEHDNRWYAIRCVTRSDYRTSMRARSPRWGTVHLPQSTFDRLARPLASSHLAPRPASGA